MSSSRGLEYLAWVGIATCVAIAALGHPWSLLGLAALWLFTPPGHTSTPRTSGGEPQEGTETSG